MGCAELSSQQEELAGDERLIFDYFCAATAVLPDVCCIRQLSCAELRVLDMSESSNG